MWARWVTFLVWAAVAASVVAWGLQLFVAAPPAPRGTVLADAAQALRGDVTRVLGADAPPPAAAPAEAPAADARFQLIGVVAPKPAGRGGVALIAIDGKPPKAYRVGAVVEAPDVVLRRVGARAAELGPRHGATTIALEIPPLPPAATGTLPPHGSGNDDGSPEAPTPPGGVAPPVPRVVAPPRAGPLPPRGAPQAMATPGLPPAQGVPPPPNFLPSGMPSPQIPPSVVPAEAPQTR